MKTNPVGWFEIYVEDMKRAKKFYESVFEVQLQRLNNPDLEMWAFSGQQNTYGAPGALVRTPGFPVGRNSVLIYFSCENCSLVEKRVKEFGGRIEKPEFSIGEYGSISFVYDTEGNMIGLHSPPKM
jgi:predicted enzyme related to lactoylglutathione lyase